jgi:hypothetical protein
LAPNDDQTREAYDFPVTDSRPWRSAGFTTFQGRNRTPADLAWNDWQILAIGLARDFARPADAKLQRLAG